MNDKNEFIKMVMALVESYEKHSGTECKDDFPEGYEYLLNICKMETSLTENGQRTIDALKSFGNAEFHTSKDIAIAAGASSRAIAGTMRKLIEMGYVEKSTSGNPVMYRLTELGQQK